MKDSVLDFVPWASQVIYGAEIHPYQTLKLCELTKNIEGDFCECGVANGGTAAVMAKYLLAEQLKKKVYLIDSFEGLPYPTEHDKSFIDNKVVPKTGELISTGVSKCKVENVIINMARWGISPDVLVYYKGWIEEVLPKIREVNLIKKLSFLRIDVDLYKPTFYSLFYLYPLLSVGGYVLVHDDGKLLGGPRKAVAEFLYDKRKQISKINHFDENGGIYWRKEK